MIKFGFSTMYFITAHIQLQKDKLSKYFSWQLEVSNILFIKLKAGMLISNVLL